MISTLLVVAALQVAPVHWTITDTTSALDGRRTYAAGVQSDTPVLNGIGRPTKASLVIGCINNARQVIIDWPKYLGRDETRVSWKIDQGEIRTETFGVMGRTSAVLSGRSADRFFAAMRTGGHLVVRVNSYEDQQETTFDLVGAGDVVDATEAACPARR